MRTSIVIGADGAIGRALASALRGHGEAVVATSRRDDAAARGHIHLDLAQMDSSPDLPAAETAYICAAMAGFAVCQEQPELARRVNVEAPAMLAIYFARKGTHSVFLSTSAVYDGSCPAVVADDPVSPRTEYGRQKAEAEGEVLKVGTAASVVRLTKVLAPNFRLFNGWIDSLKRGEGVAAFTDLALAPISLVETVEALIAVGRARHGGIYQASAATDISYFDAACHIATRLGVDPSRVRAQLGEQNGVPVDQLAKYASLDASRLAALTGRMTRTAREVIDDLFGIRLSRG